VDDIYANQLILAHLVLRSAPPGGQLVFDHWNRVPWRHKMWSRICARWPTIWSPTNPGPAR